MINEEILRIKDILLETIKPNQIYLFGSFANGSFNDQSDYDFYLTVSDTAGDIVHLSQKAYKSLRGIRKRPVDIIINYQSSFQKRKKAPTLERTVSEEGILLYEK